MPLHGLPKHTSRRPWHHTAWGSIARFQGPNSSRHQSHDIVIVHGSHPNNPIISRGTMARPSHLSNINSPTVFSSSLGQVVPHSIGVTLFSSSLLPTLAVWILLLETDRPRGPLPRHRLPRADSISNSRGHGRGHQHQRHLQAASFHSRSTATRQSSARSATAYTGAVFRLVASCFSRKPSSLPLDDITYGRLFEVMTVASRFSLAMAWSS